MNRTLPLTAILILTATAAAARSTYDGACRTIHGEPVSYCNISVLDFESGQPARIFANPDAASELPNPLTSDSQGLYHFAAEEGVYEIRFSGGTPDAGSDNVDFVWLDSQDGSWVRPQAQMHDITSYGATGNDASDDDLPAIQAALDDAEADQGVVLIPEGVFDVAPSGDCAPCLELPSGVSVIGAGEGSVLRIRAHAGPFDTLFANAGARPRDITLFGFTIDQNIEQNLGTVASTTGRFGYLLRFYAGQRVRVENMRFLYAGINAVTFNGPEVEDIALINNYAEYHQDTAVTPYDNTALYTDGYRITAAYNTVVGKIVAGMPMINGGAVGALELHGGPAVAVGNQIQDVRVCMSLVSAWGGTPDPRPASDIAAVGNRCEGVNEGIRLAAMDGRQLKRVAVAGNEISIAQARWNLPLSMGIELEWSAGLTGDFDDLTIARNAIRFADEGEGSARATALLSNVGIGLAPAGNASKVRVLGNQISGAPLMGMRIGNLLQPASSSSDILVADNRFENYGQNRLANPYFLLGIRTEGHLRNLTIEQNSFAARHDDGVKRPAIVMVEQGVPTATAYEGCVVRENEGAELSQVDASCSTQGRSAFLGASQSPATHWRAR